MTLTVISTSGTVAGFAHTFAADGDALYISDGVTWGSNNDSALGNAGFDDLQIAVHGNVLDADVNTLSGDGSHLTIGATGTWTSFNPSAADAVLYTTGSTAGVTNHGQIIAQHTIGLISAGNSDFVNTGLIDAASGVFLGLNGGTGDQLVNSGTIMANDYDDVLRNTRYNNAVFSEGGSTEVTNLAGGRLIATSSEGAGVRFDGFGGSRIVNHGEITAQQWWGIDLAGVTVGAALVVENHGLVQGGTGALLGSALSDMVTNRGVMEGDVLLGDGADLFDGRGGTVQGDVYGGAGDDVFVVDDDTLSLVEDTGEGTDLVQSLVSWALGDHFENLDLLGADDLNATGNDEFNLLNGNAGANRIQGHNGDDTVYGGSGEDTIAGGEQNDSLTGNAGNDIIWGQAGEDDVIGGHGDDWVAGNAGDDRVIGNDGDDTLIGGTGADALNGGDGLDLFLYRWVIESPNSTQSDKIRDFVVGEDVIDLGAVADGTLDFIGSSAFSGTGPELRINVYGGTNSRIRVDVDGDGVADMRIDVIGTTGLTADEFVL